MPTRGNHAIEPLHNACHELMQRRAEHCGLQHRLKRAQDQTMLNLTVLILWATLLLLLLLSAAGWFHDGPKVKCIVSYHASSLAGH